MFSTPTSRPRPAEQMTRRPTSPSRPSPESTNCVSSLQRETPLANRQTSITAPARRPTLHFALSTLHFSFPLRLGVLPLRPRVAADSALRRVHKFQHAPRRFTRKLSARLFNRLAQSSPPAKKKMIQALQLQAFGRAYSRPAQPDYIQPANPVVPARNRKRWQVLADGRPALHHG